MLQYVNYRMRITILDGRVLVGTLMAFDRHLNLVSRRFMVENDSHDYVGDMYIHHDYVCEIFITTTGTLRSHPRVQAFCFGLGFGLRLGAGLEGCESWNDGTCIHLYRVRAYLHTGAW